MDRLERFYKIQQLLERKRAVKVEEFLSELGISLATFKRDLEYMRDRFHAPVIWDRDLRGYRFETPLKDAPKFELPGLWFNAEEIRALLTMQQLLANLQPGLLEPHIEPLLSRLHSLLDVGEHPAQEVERRVRIIHHGARSLNLPHFQLVAAAVLKRHRLWMRYRGRSRGDETEREISPQRLIHYRDNWYVDAWCHLREDIRSFAVDAIIERAAALEPSLRPVINATGVVLHTNLGRAPLSDAAIDAMREVSRGYSNLEFDLERGERGSRFAHLEGLLRRLTGAEAGIAVNNNASALLLALSALARDREVVISRGQLVEIGGGFRIPDVMRQSGSVLVEVGTTNRTYLRDYADAISDRTATLLRVHASNFRVVGFTEQPPLEDLAALARARGLRFLDDVGSGALIDPRPYGLAGEPLVQDSVRAGADVVLFSGDKLLGGPQAGIAVGTHDAIEAMRRHPLARAVRLDKASIAALAATLQHYARGEATTAVPVWRMIAAEATALRRRARRWMQVVRSAGATAEVVPARSMVGGGSLPGEGLDSFACAVAASGGEAQSLAARLRRGSPAVVARIEDDRVLLDPRTVDPREDAAVASALRVALAGS